jgi:glutamate formiminotransferase
MFGAETNIGSPTVVTSTNGGLSADQITTLCVNKIVQVSENAAPEIKEQAEAFRSRLENVVYAYVNTAQRQERETCIQILAKGGYLDLAELLRSY